MMAAIPGPQWACVQSKATAMRLSEKGRCLSGDCQRGTRRQVRDVTELQPPEGTLRRWGVPGRGRSCAPRAGSTWCSACCQMTRAKNAAAAYRGSRAGGSCRAGSEPVYCINRRGSGRAYQYTLAYR